MVTALARPIQRARVVLPSSPVPDLAVFEAGLAWLRAAGVQVSVAASPAPGPLPYLAGPDLARAQALAGAFAVEDVDVVWCARGGTGALRTLTALDAVEAWAAQVSDRRTETLPAPAPMGSVSAVAAHLDDPARASRRSPRQRFDARRRHVPLIGLSDATALLLARQADPAPGVAIHGPVITQLTRLDEGSASAMRAWLAQPDSLPVLRADPGLVPVSGRAEGALVAGNLALLASCCGTPEQPELTGKILLIEEIAEPAYRVDRMMAQLVRSGALRGLRGLALGRFEGCKADVTDCLVWWAQQLAIPCVGRVPVGHGSACWPVGLGLRYLLAADEGLLAPLEGLSAWVARTAP